MSPRAAWRLEAAGFGPVHDYAAGKTDWIADLPFQGTARLAGLLTRRGAATVAEGTPAGEALHLRDAQGFGPVLVLNQAGVVMGAAYRNALASASGQAETGTVMRFGVSTVRPQRRCRRAGAPDGPCRGNPGGGDPSRRHPGRAVLRRGHDSLDLGKDTTVGRDHKHICLAARTRRGRLVGGRADMACWYRDGRWFGADAAAGSPA